MDDCPGCAHAVIDHDEEGCAVIGCTCVRNPLEET